MSGAATRTRASIWWLRALISCVERLPAAGQVAQGGLDAGQQQPIGVAGQSEEVVGLGAQPQAAVDQGPLGQHDQLVAQR